MPRYTFIPPKSTKLSRLRPATPVGSYRLDCLLMLTGNGTLTDGMRSRRLSTDYLSFPWEDTRANSADRVLEKLADLSPKEAKIFLERAAPKNIRIHQNISDELRHCLGHLHRESYIAAFVHLYRLIEHAALYIPLISVISKGVNAFAFDDYKKIITPDAKSDLSVLKKFVKNTLDNPAKDLGVKLSFASADNPTLATKVTLKVMGDLQPKNAGPDFIEVKLGDLERIIVGFRNHFFHYLFHERNVSLQDLDNPDDFLSPCMPDFMNFFALLYRELVLAEIGIWG